MNPLQPPRSIRNLYHLLPAFSLLLSLAFGAPKPAQALAAVLYAAPGGLESGSCASWGEACELRYALGTAAQNGDEIWAQAGAYLPTASADRAASFQLMPGVALYGGFAGDETNRDDRDWNLNETILSGDIGLAGDPTDNAYHVVSSSGVTETAALDGFSVTLGQADGPYVSPCGGVCGAGMYNLASSPTVSHVTFYLNNANSQGGGMANFSSSPVMSDCTFFQNTAGSMGGGLYNGIESIGDISNPVITGCTFSGNSAGEYGGGMVDNGSSTTVASCLFENNTAENGAGLAETNNSSSRISLSRFLGNTAISGGGLSISLSDAVVDSVDFESNSASGFGGGLALLSGSLVLSNAVFFDNQAASGGGMSIENDPASLANIMFAGNRATNGGGLIVLGSSAGADLSNVTFSGNIAEDWGGGLFFDTSNVSLDDVSLSGNVVNNVCGGGMYSLAEQPTYTQNSIFWGNSSPLGDQICDAFGAVNVAYSLVQDGYPGAGNIAADPQFRDADGVDDLPGTLDDDLRLAYSSPGVDAGDTTALPADNLDLDGDGDVDEPLPVDLDNAARRVDMPLAPDTGLGEPPLVDMGAYELGRSGFLFAVPGGLESGLCGSWSEACELHYALGTAVLPGEEIWAHEGTYLPNAAAGRAASFELKPGVALYGGFSGSETSRDQRDWALYETILSGDIGIGGNSSDNAYHVVSSSSVTETAVLDGFTVTGGNADGSAADSNGAGMYNYAGSPVIQHVTFRLNLAANNGGGMANISSSPVISDCVFDQNTAGYMGGGMSNELEFDADISQPNVTGCTFSQNIASSYGGGIANSASDTVVLDCLFENNQAENGGGMADRQDSHTSTSESRFVQNTAMSGGGFYVESSDAVVESVMFENNRADGWWGGGMASDLFGNIYLTEVIFSGNQATVGGGLSVFNSSAVIANASFIGNSADTSAGGIIISGISTHAELMNIQFSANIAEEAGGGIYIDDTETVSITNVVLSNNQAVNANGGGLYNQSNQLPVLNNSILWGNTALQGDQIYDFSETLTVTYSLVQGGYPGLGNIAGDPLFADADGADNLPGTPDDDMRLIFPSPALDAGSNRALPPDRLDLDGDGDTLELLPLDLDGSPRRVDVADAPDSGEGEPPLVDMGAYELVLSGIRYAAPGGLVAGSCKSWEEACELRYALQNAALAGEQIWAKEGTHLPTVGADREATFMLRSGVALYGGFVGTEMALSERDPELNETILSGDIGAAGEPTDNSYHVVTSDGVLPTALLDGFTVTGGYANGAFASPCDRACGGGMYNTYGSPTVRRVLFAENYAGSSGGAIANIASNPYLAEITVVDNSAGWAGGGMYNGAETLDVGSQPVVIGCEFSGNSAGMYGGAVANAFSQASLKECFFDLNTAGKGGAVADIWGSQTTIGSSRLTGNSASSEGGGLFVWDSNTIVAEVEFDHNTVTSAGFGGGVAVNGGYPTFAQVSFNQNSADSGGGLAARFHQEVNLVNATFIGNSAQNGGGIYVALWAEVILANAAFSGNYAEQNGGGIFVDSGDVTLNSSVVSANRADLYEGGGIFTQAQQPLTVTNSILWGNSAPGAGQIYASQDQVSVRYSLVQDGYPGAGNLDSDPRLMDAAGADGIPGTLDDDLRLQLISPAIDSGDNTALPADSLDLDGDFDTTEPLPLDLAGQSRRVNAPSVLNTGFGDPPFVDRGPYEFDEASPWVDAGADQAAAEGSLVAFSGVYTSVLGLNVLAPPPVDLEWDFGDGSLASGVLTPTHVYADEGVYTVTLTVTDPQSGSGNDQLLVTVSNVAPQVEPLPDWVIIAGETASWTVQFSDPGWLDAHTLTIGWAPGVNQTVELLAGVTETFIEHIYTTPGSNTVTVSVADDDGGAASVSAGVYVRSIPQVAAGPNQTGAEGTAVNFSGAYSETIPLLGDARAPVSLRWDFGDGSGAAGVLTPTHTYADDGVYNVTLVVTSTQGVPGYDSLLVTVNNVAPQVEALPDWEITSGELVSWTVRFSDPGWLDAHTLVVSWEPGVSETFNLPAGVNELAINHRYVHSGDFTVTVSVSDSDGGTAVTNPQVVVKSLVIFLPLVR